MTWCTEYQKEFNTMINDRYKEKLNELKKRYSLL